MALVVVTGAASGAVAGEADAGEQPAEVSAEAVREALRGQGAPRAVDLAVPGEQSRALLVSDSGVVVGVTGAGGEDAKAFRWRDGTVEVMPGPEVSEPVSVNDAGDVLVRGSGPEPQPHLYLWPAEGFVEDVCGPDASATLGHVNDDGLVAYTMVGKPEGGRARLWQDGGNLEPLDLVPSWESGVAGGRSVNDRGDVAGVVISERSTAFARRDGVITYLEPTEEYGSTDSLAINERGQVLAAVVPAFGSPVSYVLWERDGRTRAIDPAGLGFVPRALNDRGVVAGAVVPPGSTTAQAAIADTRRGVTVLRTRGGLPGAAVALTDLGVVAGWAARDAGGLPHATAWVLGRPVALGEMVSSLPGTQSAAHDVNERGRVVGTVTVTTGGQPQQRAVRWELVPRR